MGYRRATEGTSDIGYPRIAKKAQFHMSEATYLSNQHKGGKRTLSQRQISDFLSFYSGQDLNSSQNSLPALTLQSVSKSYQMFICETRHIIKRVLIQNRWPRKCPVVSLSNFDAVDTGWPTCFRAVYTTLILVK